MNDAFKCWCGLVLSAIGAVACGGGGGGEPTGGIVSALQGDAQANDAGGGGAGDGSSGGGSSGGASSGGEGGGGGSCGDGVCEGGETITTCATDCCLANPIDPQVDLWINNRTAVFDHTYRFKMGITGFEVATRASNGAPIVAMTVDAGFVTGMQGNEWCLSDGKRGFAFAWSSLKNRYEQTPSPGAVYIAGNPPTVVDKMSGNRVTYVDPYTTIDGQSAYRRGTSATYDRAGNLLSYQETVGWNPNNTNRADPTAFRTWTSPLASVGPVDLTVPGQVSIPFQSDVSGRLTLGQVDQAQGGGLLGWVVYPGHTETMLLDRSASGTSTSVFLPSMSGEQITDSAGGPWTSKAQVAALSGAPGGPGTPPYPAPTVTVLQDDPHPETVAAVAPGDLTIDAEIHEESIVYPTGLPNAFKRPGGAVSVAYDANWRARSGSDAADGTSWSLDFDSNGLPNDEKETAPGTQSEEITTWSNGTEPNSVPTSITSKVNGMVVDQLTVTPADNGMTGLARVASVQETDFVGEFANEPVSDARAYDYSTPGEVIVTNSGGAQHASFWDGNGLPTEDKVTSTFYGRDEHVGYGAGGVPNDVHGPETVAGNTINFSDTWNWSDVMSSHSGNYGVLGSASSGATLMGTTLQTTHSATGPTGLTVTGTTTSPDPQHETDSEHVSWTDYDDNASASCTRTGDTNACTTGETLTSGPDTTVLSDSDSDQY